MLQNLKHTVKYCTVVPLVKPVRSGASTPVGTKEGAALHAVPDALNYHWNECLCCGCVCEHLEHSILAVLVLLSKHVGHLHCACVDLGKVVVHSVVA